MPKNSNISGCSTGYCTVSWSSRLTSSRPPTSSHDTLGTSTSPVSRSADGLVTSLACTRSSMITDMELSTSTSMVSASRSITSIFWRMHWKAASEQSAARSAPTKPCVSLPMRSRSTSPCVFSRLGAMASISSMKMMDGAWASASANTSRRLSSLWPAIMDMISGPLTTTKLAPDSAAMARASSVLPVPGGP
ncbi:hypothetical protein CFC21_014966 [Triticum aestivum]|uniref:Uncharacterized protein n=2 Tax=Triticum aestivum TaxID=4565 RepID=A0A3B6AQB3_WHEAT|nr:hypothetical protein CFC21_014966 [Triticum aestivum]